MASPLPTPNPPPTSPPAQHTKPFRFKTRPPRFSSHRRRSASPLPTNHSTHHRHRRHHHHHHRSRRPPHNPTLPNDSTHPDAAFRESLFDALADDEGAAFWESVYGQPIHTYSPYTADEHEDGQPKLERMSDEEYVRYVRGKMWERSHGYVIEERRRREEERRRRKEREAEGRRWRDGVEEEEKRRWRGEVEEVLRRGEERRERRRWKGVWEGYVRRWEGLRFDEEEGAERGEKMRDRIAWPVENGGWKDVEREGVERFFRHAPQAGETGMALVDLLKKERVKWHPDKMQQRAGGGAIDDGTMKLVTAVFQVVDRLWNETRT